MKNFLSNFFQGSNNILRHPGDTRIDYVTPKGDFVSKIHTKDINATFRQYNKKDGTPGKKTITFKQP